MSTFMLKNNALNFTPVSNVFLEKYMPKARGEFVKVYLLMLKYNISSEPGVNSSVLASTLNLLESDIMNALNYWNDEGVIKLVPIDKMNNFSIEFLSLEDEDPTVNSDNIDIMSALNNNETKDMLNDIEKILARPLSLKEMSIYLGWQREFNFSSELILILIEYCSSKGKTHPRYIEKVAEAWHDMNIRTVEEAQINIKQNEDKWSKIRRILSYLGMNTSEVMKPQEEMLEKWLFIYKFNMDIIQKACDICFERLNRADFKYIDGILSKWNQNNIRTLEDIALKDKNTNKTNNKQYKNNYNNNNNGKALRFNDFKQREYDYDSLEKKLLGWDSDD
ncbi:DNA replication protein DnaD [Clostridium baratii]|uniref:DnaD domain protein n=1 Tax=Clostridium baratii TaxID=1561 RepID=UPI0009A298A3|nr:DnaD domain protein [Clostridium baratii]OPF52299.1 DNA replication protein DnaD [Clostridium baratii]OPF54661.1 DNA replication protein DnaD [Clostridium baratii]OPF57817.1 DNA replication protein DnaD [Clostridium baratii]OPF61334.1 DNA replication protein DnaD [Clostridium baratii]